MLMVRIAAALGMVLVVTAAAAQPRPSSVTMTCGQVRAYLASRGAAVIGTGGYTYDRFVRDRSFCQPTEATRAAFVPTLDAPGCFVGYRCFEPSRSDWFFGD
jgi:hypothetical protein